MSDIGDLIAVAAVALLATGCSSPPSVLGEGTYEVPDEIRPGTYTTPVIQDGPTLAVPPGQHWVCSWTRYDLGHHRVGGDDLGVGDRGRVVVLDTDEAVEFDGPCEWKRQEP